MGHMLKPMYRTWYASPEQHDDGKYCSWQHDEDRVKHGKPKLYDATVYVILLCMLLLGTCELDTCTQHNQKSHQQFIASS